MQPMVVLLDNEVLRMQSMLPCSTTSLRHMPRQAPTLPMRSQQLQQRCSTWLPLYSASSAKCSSRPKLYMPKGDQCPKAEGARTKSYAQSSLSTLSFQIRGPSHGAGGERLPVHSSSHRQAVEQVGEEAEEDDRDFQGIDACKGLRHVLAVWLLCLGPHWEHTREMGCQRHGLMADGCSMNCDGCRPFKVPGTGMLTIALQFQCSSPGAMYVDVRAL